MAQFVGAPIGPSQRRIWVLEGSGKAVPLDMRSGAVGASVQVGENARSLVEMDGGRLLAVTNVDGAIEVIGLPGGEVLASRRVDDTNPSIASVNGGEELAVVSSTGVTFLSVPNLRVIASVPVVSEGVPMSAWEASRTRVYVETAAAELVAVSADGVEAIVPVGEALSAVAVHEASDSVAVAAFDTGRIHVINLATYEIVQVIDDSDGRNSIRSLQFASEGGTLFAGREDGVVLRYDLSEQDPQATTLASLGCPVLYLDPDEEGSELRALTGRGWYRMDLDQSAPVADALRAASTRIRSGPSGTGSGSGSNPAVSRSAPSTTGR